jgi:hypothetical protein
MLVQSIEGLGVMEATLAADVSELVAELDRERVRLLQRSAASIQQKQHECALHCASV